MTLRSLDPDRPWTDYTITSQQSGKTYRVSLRGFEPGQSYCTCPDFRTNHLGTCKHILHAQAKIKKRFPKKKLDKPYRRKNLSLRLDYGKQLGLRFNLPHRLDEEAGEDPRPLSRPDVRRRRCVAETPAGTRASRPFGPRLSGRRGVH